MGGSQTVQVQTETRGAVPEGTVGLAVHRVNSLLRAAPEPVLFARVKLIMSADPAVQRPAIVQVNVDLNGRLIRTQAAAADAELMDYDFHLFTERSTGEDSVIYRTADGYRPALAHARNGLPGTVDPSITVSKMPAPRLSVTEAAARLEAAGQSFLFFVNAGTGRGNLIYHRYDGNYGLIAPAS